MILWLVASLAAAAPEPKPNFVVFLIDDLGWSDLGCAGSDLYETPHLDRLAARGMRFTQAYSACTVCSPTRASLMTGRYPARVRVTDWIHGHQRPKAKLKIPDWTHYLPSEEVTIAEALKAAGYATAHVGKWHLGGGELGPDRQGFEFVAGGNDRGQPKSFFSPYGVTGLTDGPPGEYLTDREAAEACGFIERNRERPFFLFVPHHAVHQPVQAPREVVEKYRAKVKAGARHRDATYAAMIELVDRSVGRVVETLERLGLAGRTVVVFASDNGGLLGTTDNAPLRAGKGSAYEGGVRVPTLIYWPGVTPAGSTCAEPVITADFFPTLLEIAGARSGVPVDGASLVPLLRDPNARLAREAIFWHYPHYHPGGATPYGAVRARDWKLVEFFEDMHVELYHLADDPGERKDLAASNPAKADELRRRLHEWRASVGAQMPTPNPNYRDDGK
jgi:arylsulfatase A-like enzyme